VKITPKQQRFVSEYLKDRNATQAAIRAGYSAHTADVQGPRLLGNVGVAEAIALQTAKVERRNDITVDRVIQEFATVALVDITDPKNMDADGLPVYRAPDKLRALEALGKHLGMFPSRVQVGGDPKGEPVKTQHGWSPDAVDFLKREILGIGKDGE
jgi:phage terminase small subunit